jgi:hypothetical protein
MNLQGVGTNGGPVYLAPRIAGKTAVVTHPDANAYRSTKWLTWKIPLSTFSDAGVKVNAIKTLYIGVGDRGDRRADREAVHRRHPGNGPDA